MTTMSPTRSAKAAASLLVALIAAVTLTVGAPGASATSVLVIREGSSISIGSILVERQAEGDLPYAAGDLVDGTHYGSHAWFITGGDPSVPNIFILFHVDFVHDVHAYILNVVVSLPDSDCQIVLTGEDDAGYLIDLLAGDEYHLNAEIGNYLLVNCDFGETILIVTVLGGDPSDEEILVTFDIGMELI